MGPKLSPKPLSAMAQKSAPLKAKALKTTARSLLQPATFSASLLFPQPNTTAPPPRDLWDRLGFFVFKDLSIHLFMGVLHLQCYVRAFL